MSNVNLVILSGRLGSEPREAMTPSGKLKSYFSIATNEYNSQTQQEDVTWHGVTVYGANAKRALKLLSKGDFVTVQGKLDVYEKPVKMVDPKTGEIKDTTIKRVEVIGLNLDFEYNSLNKVVKNLVGQSNSFQGRSVDLSTNTSIGVSSSATTAMQMVQSTPVSVPDHVTFEDDDIPF